MLGQNYAGNTQTKIISEPQFGIFFYIILNNVKYTHFNSCAIAFTRGRFLQIFIHTKSTLIVL